MLKSIRFVLCKVKKGWFYQEKLDPFFFFSYVKEIKKKDYLKEDPHSWDKFIIHASYIKKKRQDFNLTFNSFF